jgi:hypothetical protein
VIVIPPETVQLNDPAPVVAGTPNTAVLFAHNAAGVTIFVAAEGVEMLIVWQYTADDWHELVAVTHTCPGL